MFTIVCKRWLLVIIVLVMGAAGYSQVKLPASQEVKPLGPEAAAIFKVLDRPIGTYTGTVPVQFPLFGVSSGPLRADMSLSYNGTGGIKVEEMSTCMGLGFSLNDAGGRITQIVNGKRDDEGNGSVNGLSPSGFNSSNMTHVNQMVILGERDPEPDMFMYSFNGQTGRFIIKEDSTIIMLQKTGIKIEPFWDSPTWIGIKRWIVTDEQGNKYYFGWNQAVDRQAKSNNTYETYPSSGTPSEGVSGFTWYLLEVDDMNEENTITYTYVSTSAVLSTQVSSFRLLSGGGGYPCQKINLLPDYTQVDAYTSEAVVASITGRDDSIVVNTANDRTDGGGRRVTSIELYKRAGALKRRFSFNHSYFNSGSSDPYVKRLKLLNFSQTGSSGSEALTWSFQYNEASNGSYDLPSRKSMGYDHWGYYNGIYNTSPHPNIVYRDGVGNLYQLNSESNRGANGSAAQASTLKKITYPTGGTREFVYEGNRAHIFYDPDEYHPNDVYTTSRSASNISFTSFDNNVSAPSISQKGYFTVNSISGYAPFTFTPASDPWSDGCTAIQASLYRISTANQSTGGTFVSSSFPLPYLTNGYYRLDIVKQNSCTSLNHSAAWEEEVLPSGTFTSPHRSGSLCASALNVGGVRVKEIRDYDPVTGKTSTTSYEYKLYSTDPAKSSGLLLMKPKYVYTTNGNGCNFVRVSTSARYPLGGEGGGAYVVYPEVRTVQGGNGWVDQVFSFKEDDLSLSTFPEPPPVDRSGERGLLLEEKYYNQGGSLLKKITNTYLKLSDMVTPLSQIGWRIRAFWYDKDTQGNWWWYEGPVQAGTNPTAPAYCTSYYRTAFAIDKSKTIETLYTPNGTYVTETEYGYTYTADKKMMLTQVKTKVNNGATRITRYRYPFTATGDFTFGLSGGETTMKTTLNGKNYLQPIEAVNFLKPASGTEKLLGGTKIIFGTFNTSKLHLATLRSYTNISTYTDVNYTQYDSYGNLREQYKTSGVKEAYLWGYKANYPVAKVVGSTYSTVAGLVNQSVLDNPYSPLAMSSELDKIGRGLAGQPALVSTYTYDPLVGMTSMTDPSGRITRYNYDPFGRLILVRDHEDKVVKKLCYNYQGQSYPCTVSSQIGNQVQNISFRRVNCGDGYAGSNVSYSVAANTHYAPTQVEANLQALSEAYANGPAYANMTGTCTAATVSISYYTFSFFNPLAITFTFTSQTSGAQHVRTTIAGSSSGVLQGGTVPAGLYTVQINNPNSGNHFYDLACSAFVSGTGTQTVYNVVVHPDCPEVYIDY